MLRLCCLKLSPSCRGWEYFDFVDEWSSEFNWDGLTIWDTVATFQHYPGEPPAPACLDGRRMWGGLVEQRVLFG